MNPTLDKDGGMAGDEQSYRWTFQRMGGLDQVLLRSPDELLHFDDLDPRLWVALSCPVEGLRLDARMLELLDSDKDGRIRVREVQDAVRWTAARLEDPSVLAERRADFPLSRIRGDSDEGRRLLASARRILRGRGKPEDANLDREDVAEAMRAVCLATFNGDGVLLDRPELDPDLRRFIVDVVTITGGVEDASGERGADLACAERLMAEAAALRDWKQELDAAAAAFPLGEGAHAAFELFRALEGKIDDYFIRCAVAAYEPGAEHTLNASEAALARLGETRLDANVSLTADLPLAHIAADRPLPLYSGLNPAWLADVTRLRETVILPLLGARDALSAEDWAEVKARFAPYAAVADRKPSTEADRLGWDRLAELLSSDVAERFAAVVRKDLEGREEIEAIADVERLVLYHAQLHRLLMNFVSFHDFYTRSSETTFQIGTLYLDGRSCHLCLGVDDVEQHAAQAKLSRLCLVYCQCRRKDQSETRTIAAAVTAGDAVFLVPGRHGVFVDNENEEWDATLIKLVDNPISIRTAIFSPYRRLARMVSQQVTKLTAARDEKLMAGASKSLEKLSSPAPAAAPAAPPAKAPALPFDIGKSVGIFAALGIAFGAIGTAVAGMAAALMSMDWWQFPLLLVSAFAIVSGPSVVLAWLNLRKRTLGPALDASGWAVNTQIPINLTMGRFLTGVGHLPENAASFRDDPLRAPSLWKKRLLYGAGLCLAALIAAGAYWGWTQYGPTVMERLNAPAAAEAPSDAAKPEPPAAPADGK